MDEILGMDAKLINEAKIFSINGNGLTTIVDSSASSAYVTFEERSVITFMTRVIFCVLEK